MATCKCSSVWVGWCRSVLHFAGEKMRIAIAGGERQQFVGEALYTQPRLLLEGGNKVGAELDRIGHVNSRARRIREKGGQAHESPVNTCRKCGVARPQTRTADRAARLESFASRCSEAT